MTTSTRCQHRFCLFIWSPASQVEYFFFLNCQKFRDTVPLKPVKPIAHLSAFHVVDIVKVNDGDGFSGSTRHFFLCFLGSLQQQKNKNNNNNIFFSSFPQQPATTTKNNNNNIFFTSVSCKTPSGRKICIS